MLSLFSLGNPLQVLLEVSSKSPQKHLDWLPVHEEPHPGHKIFAQSWQGKQELAENPVVI